MGHSQGKPLSQLDGDLGVPEVHVWYGSPVDVTRDMQRQLLGILNDDERRRAARFKVDAARTQFVVSRGWLRLVLGRYLRADARQIELRFSRHGKPELTNSHGLHFNLSHTLGLTAIAVTRLGLIGIDVEKISRERDVLNLAKRFFSGKEADWVASKTGAEQTRAFLTCWTAKEAFIKAHGEGLSIPLDSFAIMPAGGGILKFELFKDPSESRRWSVSLLDVPSGFQGAVAVEASGFEVRVGELPSSLEKVV